MYWNFLLVSTERKLCQSLCLLNQQVNFPLLSQLDESPAWLKEVAESWLDSWMRNNITASQSRQHKGKPLACPFMVSFPFLFSIFFFLVEPREQREVFGSRGGAARFSR